jgi:toxin ParE1/3/4
MAVTFVPAAVKDLEDIGDYIHAENPEAAFRFVTELGTRCSRQSDIRGGFVASVRCRLTVQGKRYPLPS